VFRAKPGDEGSRVQTFGMRDYKPVDTEMARAKQIRILSYTSERDFVVKLIPEGGRDEILLCRVPPGETLSATMQAAFSRIASGEEEGLDFKDTLLMPKFDFDLRHSYDGVVGRELLNEGFEKQEVLALFQDIRLRFDERGAVVRSRMAGAFGARMEPAHVMRFDGPFLMMLKETDQSEPYFAMWVGNDELLRKVPADEPAPAGGD
jgi:hypothetical protein